MKLNVGMKVKWRDSNFTGEIIEFELVKDQILFTVKWNDNEQIQYCGFDIQQGDILCTNGQ